MKKVLILGVVGGALYMGTTSHGAPVASTHASGSAAAAIGYAQQQIGKPYCYGAPTSGSCPAGTFDCSGLMMAAWTAAGKPIPRTSEEQWASLPHVSSPQPGDLIFYTGSAIDPPPGHVTMYIGGGRMIEAYGTGVPVRETPVRAGATGYADPAASGAAS